MSSISGDRGGFTLVELLTVVAIVAVVALLALPRLASVADDAKITVARHDLAEIRAAVVRLVGDLDGAPHFHKVNPLWNATDLSRYDSLMSVSVHQLFAPTNYLVDLVTRTQTVDVAEWEAAGLKFLPSAYAEFDPLAGRGWRGPYLDPSRAEFRDNRHCLVDPWGTPYKLQFPDPQELISGDCPFPLAWCPSAASGADYATSAVFAERRWQFARVVSAGPDGRFQTDNLDAVGRPRPTVFANLVLDEHARVDSSERGDDLVLFINRADVWEDFGKELWR